MIIKKAPNENLEGTEALLGCRYAEIRDELSSYDWEEWYPILRDGEFVGYYPAWTDEAADWDECELWLGSDGEFAYDEEHHTPDEDDPVFILCDLDGYGSAYPVCVRRDEAEDLMRGWYAMDENAPEFDEVWREAEPYEIAKYGYSECPPTGRKEETE